MVSHDHASPGGPASHADPLWFKDAVIYQLHVKSYFDGNDDGIGDFQGLISRLDYIAGLGVNTLWLLPFYPSPRRDDGYDIAEYCAVHPDYGTLDDARAFIDEAHRRGLRVITELVINHTSDQHPWFRRARAAPPGSWERAFYVWSDSDQRYAGTRIIFLDTEKSNWSWDEQAGAYYWHRFYAHQPDLNFDHPPVLDALLDVMRFWLALGVDGLRLDAVPYLVEREGTSNENLPETHAVLRRIRKALDAEFPGRMLLAEANQWPEDTQLYFGHGDECHMAFHFPLMPRMYMAIAQQDRFPITDILRQTPAIPDNCQWAIFLRNHDELTLEMVTDSERDYLWETYASDRRARLNLGIRRRLAPLLNGDRRRIELLNSLLLSMPGTPVIYYGDEIGMGDDLHLGDRDGVRTPMQWSPDRNGGFSRADPARLVLPVITDAQYGYAAVNVERQHADSHSLLSGLRRLLQVRAMHSAFGRGTLQFLYPSNRRVLAYLREYTRYDGSTESILCLVNLSPAAQPVELDLSRHAGQVPVELAGGSAFPPLGPEPYRLTLAPYGFLWFLLAAEARMPVWYQPPPEPLADLRTLVLRGPLDTLLDSPLLDQLENELLPEYLARRPWFKRGDPNAAEPLTVRAWTLLPALERPMLLLEIGGGAQGKDSHTLLPLGFIPEQDLISTLPQQLALARARRGSQLGLLTDAITLDGFGRGVLRLLRERAMLRSSDGTLHFLPTPALQALDGEGADSAEVRRPSGPFQDTLVVGERAILRVLRTVLPGTHPEVELALHLTEAGFAAQLPMLGQVTRVDGLGVAHSLMVVHEHRFHEGDAEERTLAALERALQHGGDEDLQAARAADTDGFDEALMLAQRAGALAGDLHALLTQPCADAAFAPGEFDAKAADVVVAELRGKLDLALLALKRGLPELSGDAYERVQTLTHLWSRLLNLPERHARRLHGTPRLRVHGHLSLRRMLVVQGALNLIPVDGEPPLERRARHSSPLADLASLLLDLDRQALRFATPDPATEGAGPAARRSALAQRYHLQARAALLDAWQATAPAACVALLGDGGQAGDERMELFLLEAAASALLHPGPPCPSACALLLGLAHARGAST